MKNKSLLHCFLLILLYFVVFSINFNKKDNLLSNLNLLQDIYSSSEEKSKIFDFTLKNIQTNENFKLSDYLKKNVILLVFSATWCPYCRREYPILNELYKKYVSSGFVIININIGETEKKVKKMVQDKKIIFPVLVDSEQKVAKQYEVSGIPLNILIDGNEKIIYKENGITDDMNGIIEKELEKLNSIENKKDLKSKTRQ